MIVALAFVASFIVGICGLALLGFWPDRKRTKAS